MPTDCTDIPPIKRGTFFDTIVPIRLSSLPSYTDRMYTYTMKLKSERDDIATSAFLAWRYLMGGVLDFGEDTPLEDSEA